MCTTTPPQRIPRRTRNAPVGDMLLTGESDAEMDRLFTVLRKCEREGRFSSVPASRLAQAIVPFVDPFVFLRTPRACATVDAWPIDGQLDSLDAAAARETLERVTQVDLDASVRLIAGNVRTYSRDWDVMASVDHVVPRGTAGSEDQRSSVLNGKASLALEDPAEVILRGGASDQTWLTMVVGGLMPFIDATLDFLPSEIWQSQLSWVPDARNPLIWTREGRRVAWFERLRGPVRSIYPGDLIYRQSILARWICVEDEWHRIEDIVGPPRRRVRIERAPANRGDR